MDEWEERGRSVEEDKKKKEREEDNGEVGL